MDAVVLAQTLQTGLTLLGLLAMRAISRKKFVVGATLPVRPPRTEVVFLVSAYLLSEIPLDVYVALYPTSQFVWEVEGFVFLILLIAPLLALRFFGGGFRSVRVQRKGVFSSLILGIVASLVLVIPYAAYSPSYAIALANSGFVPVGLGVLFAFVEEFFYRGFLQTRLEGLFGMNKGLLLASLLFMFAHVSRWVTDYGDSYQLAFLLVVISIPTAIALGYIAQKSDNLIGSTILHVAYNLPFTL